MLEAALQFQTIGTPVSSERYGNGHINETYLVITDQEVWYILQKINHLVFSNVPSLMENIAGVTRWLAKHDSDPRHVLTLVPTKEGKDFLSEFGGFWRMYVFVTDSICLERPESTEDFLQSAVAFGRFQNQLADYPAHELHETIPHFHDTVDRYRKLDAAIEEDAYDRLKDVQEEVAFALARRDEAATMVNMQKAGELPLRVTHNDTKLNNVMLDAKTRKPLCVIDLDTVMPGLAGNDFGDSIRFGASTAAEDERDLSKVNMSLEMYEAYTRGFLSACRANLTDAEINTLPLGAKLMTLECGVRFLTDHLNGDVYFRTHYSGHNLDRCRTQFKLVADMEQKWDTMQQIVEKEAAK